VVKFLVERWPEGMRETNEFQEKWDGYSLPGPAARSATCNVAERAPISPDSRTSARLRPLITGWQFSRSRYLTLTYHRNLTS
jgi:hypothetical protein